jgi:hypothetical protein
VISLAKKMSMGYGGRGQKSSDWSVQQVAVACNEEPKGSIRALELAKLQ